MKKKVAGRVQENARNEKKFKLVFKLNRVPFKR